MKNTRIRKLREKARFNLRKDALTLVFSCKSPAEVAKIFGCHRSAIWQWLRMYRNTGLEGLKSRKSGAPSKLSDDQKKEIFDALIIGGPERYELPSGLWSLPLVKQLIENVYEIVLSEVTIGRMLKQFGFSFKVQVENDLNRHVQVKFATWMQSEEFKAHKREARRINAITLFEHCLSLKIPRSITIISSTSSQGQVFWIMIRGKVTSKKYSGFLQRLIESYTRPVYLFSSTEMIFSDGKINKIIKDSGGRLSIFKLPNF